MSWSSRKTLVAVSAAVVAAGVIAWWATRKGGEDAEYESDVEEESPAEVEDAPASDSAPAKTASKAATPAASAPAASAPAPAPAAALAATPAPAASTAPEDGTDTKPASEASAATTATPAAAPSPAAAAEAAGSEETKSEPAAPAPAAPASSGDSTLSKADAIKLHEEMYERVTQLLTALMPAKEQGLLSDEDLPRAIQRGMSTIERELYSKYNTDQSSVSMTMIQYGKDPEVMAVVNKLRSLFEVPDMADPGSFPESVTESEFVEKFRLHVELNKKHFESLVEKHRGDGLTGARLLSTVNREMLENAASIAQETKKQTGLSEKEMQAGAMKFRTNPELGALMRGVLEYQEAKNQEILGTA